MMELLVAYGADVNAEWHGEYPIIYSAGEAVDPTVDGAGVGGHTPIFHAVTQFRDSGLPIARWLVERGADLRVRAILPGHYERPDEFIECTPLGYAKRFMNEPPSSRAHGGVPARARRRVTC